MHMYEQRSPVYGAFRAIQVGQARRKSVPNTAPLSYYIYTCCTKCHQRPTSDLRKTRSRETAVDTLQYLSLAVQAYRHKTIFIQSALLGKSVPPPPSSAPFAYTSLQRGMGSVASIVV